jgi:uncharacterized protein
LLKAASCSSAARRAARHFSRRACDPEPDYNIVLIDLDEGPRLMSRVDGIAPGAVTIGMPVQAKIITENEAPTLIFEPAA